MEEIVENCIQASAAQERLSELERKVAMKLVAGDTRTLLQQLPRKISLTKFLQESKFVFIALHGGIGEDGTLQRMLEERKIPFNGSSSIASALCVNKNKTKERIKQLCINGVSVAVGKVYKIGVDRKSAVQVWKELTRDLKTRSVVVKPVADGCSSGIVRLNTALDLQKYIDLIQFKMPHIPKGTFNNQPEAIVMPIEPLQEMLFEEYVTTDMVRVRGNKLFRKHISGWVEITVGVFQNDDDIHVLNPSLTVSEGEVLSVEEKFQGGTGINLTPPPTSIISAHLLELAKQHIRVVAEGLGLEGYARIDAFVHTETGDLMIIEVNTLPGLTPSTVLYHQALAETPAIFPTRFLESLIENKKY